MELMQYLLDIFSAACYVHHCSCAPNVLQIDRLEGFKDIYSKVASPSLMFFTAL
jgi:hypothetical protein